MTTCFFQIKRQQLAVICTVLAIPVSSLFGQVTTYKGQTVTGTLTQAGTVNMKQLSTAAASVPGGSAASSTGVSPAKGETHVRPVLRPPARNSGPFSDV